MLPSILGIDVAARKLDLVWSNGVESDYVAIENDASALQKYVRQHRLRPATCTVGLEATGDHHFAATRFLLKRGFTVKILNPIITKRYTQTTVRGIKTDKTDAEHIVRLVAEGAGESATMSNVHNRSKELMRLSRSLIKVKTQLMLRLQSVQRKDVGGTKKIEGKISKIIDSLDVLSNELVDDVTTDRTQDEELIDSIPGFSVKLSAIVHHELGDVPRFKNARSLVAFAGLDPRVKQSGGKLHTSGRLMKRGSPYLRSALFLAANVARMHDPELAEYYAKKKTEGRSHKEVLCIISRKLLYRIWAVLRDKREYEVTNKEVTENS
jgi:transposase